MNQNTSKSIWDDMPDEWKKPLNTHAQPSFNEVSVQPTSDDAQCEVKTDTNKRDFAEEQEDITGQNPANESICDSNDKTNIKKEKKSKKELYLKQNNRRIDRAKYLEFEHRIKESRENSAEHVKKAYQAEEKANKQDFIVLGIVSIVIVVAIVTVMMIFTRTSTQKIYDLIDQGNYSTAYNEISELHEKGRNVDSLVFLFAEKCISDSEYKRAVGALQFLSAKAATNKNFFDLLVSEMVSHGKQNRAIEVIDYMNSHGSTLENLAKELTKKYLE